MLASDLALFLRDRHADPFRRERAPRRALAAERPDPGAHRRSVVRRRLAIVWGVTPLLAPWLRPGVSVLERFRDPLRATGLVKPGSRIVLIAGSPNSVPGGTDLLHVATI